MSTNSGIRHCIKSSLIALWNFLSFQFRNLWRAWNGQHWLFHNLALFSIYGNDGTTVSKRGVIINLKKYHWEKVQKGIPLSSNKLFSLNKQYISRKRWMLNYRNPIIFLEKPTTSCLDILGLHKKSRGRTHQISYIDWAWSSVDSRYT